MATGPTAGLVAVVIAVAVRVAVAAVLVVGPATDEPAELAGWDAERFQAIAERAGPAWSVEPVEYPPGSVVIFDALAGSDVVATHRRLVTLSVIVDLATAAALWRVAGRRVGQAFLLLGLPLVPLGYQRLDTLVAAVATAAVLVLVGPDLRRGLGRSGGEARPGLEPGPEPALAPGPDTETLEPVDRGPVAREVLAGALLAVGALIKVWPAVLVVGALAIGRWRAAASAAVVGGVAGVAWLASVGHGLDPVDQVLSLRGATGWHVESAPGALTALAGDAEARLELNAYRIGTLRPGLVTVGRLVAVGVMAALAAAGWRARAALDPVLRFALAASGAVAALLATAPLLSPQFLVWLVPLAALLPRSDPANRGPGAGRWPLRATAVAAVLTGVTLTVFRPDGLTATVPALALTVRNLALVAVVATSLWSLSPAARAPR